MSFKVPARHGLSKWISKLVRSMNMRNTQFTSSNWISNEMEVNGDVHHTRMEHEVVANITGTYIVTIDGWSGWDLKFQLLKKIHDPIDFSGSGGNGFRICLDRASLHWPFFWSHELDLNQYLSILGNYPFSRALFSSPQTPKTFQDSMSHRILRHMHGALNIDKTKTSCTICL